MTNFDIEAFIANAVEEDCGDGDHTSLACIPEETHTKALLLCKDSGILAGMELAQQIFQFIDPALKFDAFMKDGDHVSNGDRAFEVSGNARSILKSERLVLNCMQRMSGIATVTHKLVSITKKYNVRILDTRKTTPGFRGVEKWAVKIGGGENHRFGLYDMILIKDNHIDAAGSIEKAIQAVNNYIQQLAKPLKIEIEARNLLELDEILSVGKIDRIMLDNFSIDDLKTAVNQIDSRYETEASGGINETNIEQYAQTGIDFISVGALTHHITSLDLSLKIA